MRRCACPCRQRFEAPATLRGRPRVYFAPACRLRMWRRRKDRALSVSWYTPPDVFREGMALAGLDGFDLDPCTSERSPIWPLVPSHYTEADDGLYQDWFGRVWLNPPYGRKISQWTQKAAQEYASGRVSCVVALVPAKTDTAWHHDMLAAGALPTFRRGRIRFLEPMPDGSLVLGGAGRFPSQWLILPFRNCETKASEVKRTSLDDLGGSIEAR